MKQFLSLLTLVTLMAFGSSASAQTTLSSSGSVPKGLPARLMVGLFEDTGKTWMRDSGVPWDVRYRYFTKGWVNNWGYGPADGSWGLKFMQESAAQGFIPAIQYYQMNNEPGGGESAFYAKTQNATTMRSYFSDFKTLMTRVKEFGKPTLILLEADGFGYMQQQSKGNPNAYAAVAATGLPELAGLPNTVAGWGLAFLQLRKAVGAGNAILGIHISGWASGKDLAYFSVTDSLAPEVQKVHDFLKPLGLGPNGTGATYDVLVGDPLDRDSDFYRLTLSQNRWWKEGDSEPISSSSFNRYAEWLRLWNVASGKRWVLWQIPLGNSQHLNVDNAGGPRQGYKDNRPEYFFGTGGDKHRQRFVNSGVIALLFGRGEGRQSSYTNDYYTDGQLFMKSRAGAFLKAGGLAVPPGPGSITLPPPLTLPAFTSTVKFLASGRTFDLTATVTATGAPLSNAIVNIEVRDTAGTKVGQKSFSGQTFATGQSASYGYVWTAPAAGTYTVKVGVMGSTWTPTYAWNDAAASLRSY
jgi:hypothetical protein